MNARVDHLVIVADTLEQGSQWCETTLGAAPVEGGHHALMATHNRLLAIGGDRFPDTYLEIIAIDRSASTPARARWYAMDDPALQAAARAAPRLVHAVARTAMIEMVRWGLINCGLDPGVPIAVERDTPAGTLKWRITVRDDGRIERAGALPTLIEWQGAHPCDRLPASRVVLRELTLRGLPPQALDVLKLPAVHTVPAGDASSREPALRARFDTPNGPVTLDSWA
ncbi:MAG: VOC family protein [Burkholderiales bacterium]